jgi:hypothetical protein
VVTANTEDRTRGGPVTIKAKKIADYFDAKTTGLGLRVSPTGSKSWSMMFTIPGSEKRARIGLGTYPATSLARARMLAIEARGKVEAGEDPRHVSEPEIDGAMTVAGLAESYIAKHARKIKTGRELERRLRGDVLPLIGSVKLADLHRRVVHRVLDTVLDRDAPQSAGKVFGDLRAMLRWAVERGYLDRDVLQGVKRPVASKPRERWLTKTKSAPCGQHGRAPDTDGARVKLALVTGRALGKSRHGRGASLTKKALGTYRQSGQRTALRTLSRYPTSRRSDSRGDANQWTTIQARHSADRQSPQSKRARLPVRVVRP